MASLITRGLEKTGKDLARAIKQGRFAAAVALSRTAYQATQDLKVEAAGDLDAPTPFTLRGFRYEKATKKNLEAAVYLAPIQAEYLQWQIEGGRRKARAKTGEAIPVRIRLNAFGNIPGRHRGKIRKLMARKDTFIGEIKGVFGLWQRIAFTTRPEGGKRNTKTFKRTRNVKKHSKRLRLLVSFEQTVDYKPKFDFYAEAARSFNKHYLGEFEQAYKKALSTAR